MVTSRPTAERETRRPLESWGSSPTGRFSPVTKQKAAPPSAPSAATAATGCREASASSSGGSVGLRRHVDGREVARSPEGGSVSTAPRGQPAAHLVQAHETLARHPGLETVEQPPRVLGAVTEE